jgi:hypothetical protein
MSTDEDIRPIRKQKATQASSQQRKPSTTKGTVKNTHATDKRKVPVSLYFLSLTIGLEFYILFAVPDSSDRRHILSIGSTMTFDEFWEVITKYAEHDKEKAVVLSYKTVWPPRQKWRLDTSGDWATLIERVRPNQDKKAKNGYHIELEFGVQKDPNDDKGKTGSKVSAIPLYNTN